MLIMVNYLLIHRKNGLNYKSSKRFPQHKAAYELSRKSFRTFKHEKKQCEEVK